MTVQILERESISIRKWSFELSRNEQAELLEEIAKKAEGSAVKEEILGLRRNLMGSLHNYNEIKWRCRTKADRYALVVEEEPIRRIEREICQYLGREAPYHQ